MNPVRLTIAPVPDWVDAARLLGVDAPIDRAPTEAHRVRLSVSLPPDVAADVVARLRGLGLDGQPLSVTASPALSRTVVRAARLRDARARRDTTPGFTRPGARASGEGRYSLTPEALALAVGGLARGGAVVDACCGSGGSAIGFARAGCRVIAIEHSAERLAEARHNAAIYGVAGHIAFVQGDACVEVPARGGDVLFVDPPWGEGYDKRATDRAAFPLLDALLARDLTGYGAIWVKVPSSFAVASIPGGMASAWFGEAGGDAHRIKFVLVQSPPTRPG
ncbi:MAG: methyltransferase domain-containing protein [Polyangiales bacterium]